MPDLPSILDEFTCVADCPVCLGEGIVCEDHIGLAWGPGICDHRDLMASLLRIKYGDRAPCWCGAAGAPCPEIGNRK